jgi:hypothetical protein
MPSSCKRADGRRVEGLDRRIEGQLCLGGALVDMTSNQNAQSTKSGDYDWLIGIFTKATSNQISTSTKGGDSHWRKLVSSMSALLITKS